MHGPTKPGFIQEEKGGDNRLLISLIMNRKPFCLLTAVFFIIAGLSLAAAPVKQAKATVSVSANVGQEIVLNLSAAGVDFGPVTPSGSPYIKQQAVSATVYANVPWALTHSATLLTRNGGTETLPDIEFQADNTGGFSIIPRSTQAIKSGAPTPGTTTVFDYKLTVPWTNTPPGTYTGAITYVAIAQ